MKTVAIMTWVGLIIGTMILIGAFPRRYATFVDRVAHGTRFADSAAKAADIGYPRGHALAAGWVLMLLGGALYWLIWGR